MTRVTALARVNVTAKLLERRVRPNAFDWLDRLIKPEQRDDLDQTANGDHEKAQHEKKKR